MKTCKDCKKEKSESMFYGTQNECKECTKARVRANYGKIGNAYDRTEKGVIRVIYKTQKRNSKVRGHNPPAYTKEELKDWLYENGFKKLYDNWKSSGYKKDLKPSVDRLDDFKPYSLWNIKLGTWLDNRNKQYQDVINGTGTSGMRCKKLARVKGSEKTVYPSYSSAQRDMGYSLEYQIKNKIPCRNGYYWEYV